MHSFWHVQTKFRLVFVWKTAPEWCVLCESRPWRGWCSNSGRSVDPACLWGVENRAVIAPDLCCSIRILKLWAKLSHNIIKTLLWNLSEVEQELFAAAVSEGALYNCAHTLTHNLEEEKKVARRHFPCIGYKIGPEKWKAKYWSTLKRSGIIWSVLFFILLMTYIKNISHVIFKN